jgi:phosphoribosyl 1,2-cyclic phosphodiesterase
MFVLFTKLKGNRNSRLSSLYRAAIFFTGTGRTLSSRLFIARLLSGGHVRVCLLASGSKGNSLYIETGSAKILVDAGLSAREITARLALLGVSGSEIDGIIVTHEHGDHVRGAGALARKFSLPVLISYPAGRQTTELFRSVHLVEFESGCSFEFRDILIDPFPVTHDTADPVGLVLESHEGRIGVATDLGIGTRLVQEKLKGCGVLVLESNHDEEMLANGPYPWHLKQRVKSRHGHLSNRDSAALFTEVMNPGLEALFLAHLSEVNNHPDVALKAFSVPLSEQTVCNPQVIVGSQQCISEEYYR